MNKPQLVALCQATARIYNSAPVQALPAALRVPATEAALRLALDDMPAEAPHPCPDCQGAGETSPGVACVTCKGSRAIAPETV